MASPEDDPIYAGYGDSRFEHDPRRAAVWSAIADYLQRHVPEGASLLDLGSGYCEFVNAIRAARRYALDLHLDPALHAGPGVTPIRADAADLSAIEEPLDVVFSSNLLEHLSAERACEVARAVLAGLRPGGRWILLQPNFRYCATTYFDDYTHRTIFTHVSLPDLLRANGFEIEEVVPRFLPFSMKTRAPTWKPLVWAYLRSPWRPRAKQMLVIARRPA